MKAKTKEVPKMDEDDEIDVGEEVAVVEEPDSYEPKQFNGQIWIVSWKDKKRGGLPAKVYTNRSHAVSAAKRAHKSGAEPRIFEVNTMTRLPLKTLGSVAVSGSVLMGD